MSSNKVTDPTREEVDVAIKSILKPEGSIILGAAVIGLVVSIYNGGLGSMATAHATDTADPNLTVAKKKCGWTAAAAVAGVALLTRDANIVVLGGAAIIAEELGYVHAIHSDPGTGRFQLPLTSAYQPAQTAVPVAAQGTYPVAA
jgi:hypothetical protein